MQFTILLNLQRFKTDKNTKTMKKAIYLFLVVMSLGSLAYAQEVKDPKEVPAPPNPNAGEMTFETEVHDYGTIKQGAEGTYEFKFTNTGKEPVLISNARGSCGCTVPTWPKEAIKKGETSSIKVHYD